MANIQSQKKRNLTNEKARIRNKSIRSEVKTAEKRVAEAIEWGADADEIREAGHAAQKAIGVAQRKGTYKKNTAARMQSNVASRVNSATIDA